MRLLNWEDATSWCWVEVEKVCGDPIKPLDFFNKSNTVVEQ
jgi:hypothetical protein